MFRIRRRGAPIPSGPIACFVSGIVAAGVGFFAYGIYQHDPQILGLAPMAVILAICCTPVFKALRKLRRQRLEAEAAAAEVEAAAEEELEESDSRDESVDESSEEEAYEPPRDPEGRLRTLEDLRARELISSAEYDLCRAEILRQI